MAFPHPNVRGRAKGSPSERKDPPPDLDLAKSHILSRYHDVSSQGQLHRESVGDPVRGHHDRLGDRVTPHYYGIVRPLPGPNCRPGLQQCGPYLGEIQSGAEMVPWLYRTPTRISGSFPSGANASDSSLNIGRSTALYFLGRLSPISGTLSLRSVVAC